MIERKIIELRAAVEGIEQSVERIAKGEDKVNWEQARVDAAIAAMPIADKIVDGLCGATYHSTNTMHTIDFFVGECVAIADALIAELKKKGE